LARCVTAGSAGSRPAVPLLWPPLGLLWQYLSTSHGRPRKHLEAHHRHGSCSLSGRSGCSASRSAAWVRGGADHPYLHEGSLYNLYREGMGKGAEASVRMAIALTGERASLESLHRQPPWVTTAAIQAANAELFDPKFGTRLVPANN
jgi:hypothetical protein